MQTLRRLFTSISGVVLAGSLGLLALAPATAYASNSCTASITPTSLDVSSETALTYSIHNTGTTAIQWIQVAKPNSAYDVNGITQSGWTDATDSSGTTLTEGTIAADATYSFQLAMATGADASSAAAWTIGVSTETDGSSQFSCTGSLSTSVAAAPDLPPGGTAPSVALTQFLQIFETVGIGFAALIVPFFVLTWVIRLVAEVLKGK